MNGELAQIIALVAYGNYYLNGGLIDFTTNSTFQFVSEVKFAQYKSKFHNAGNEVARSVEDWFAFLRSQKVSRLWNIEFNWDRQDLAEHIVVSFSGGVPRAIQADLPGGFELWYPRWTTGGMDKRKPWLIEYRGLQVSHSYVIPVQALGLVKANLQAALVKAQEFALRPEVDLGNFVDCFSSALRMLDSSQPEGAYHPDLLPPSGYGLAARQVLAGATQAYVFGGMGSWNDIGFTDKNLNEEYEKVTRELFEAVKFALLSASNSFEI
jgi:hypothetical protein